MAAKGDSEGFVSSPLDGQGARHKDSYLFVLKATFITFSGGSHHSISRTYEKWCQLSPLVS